MITTPINLIFHIFLKKKPFEGIDQKRLWESRGNADWEEIDAIETDPYYRDLDRFILEKLKSFNEASFLEIGCYYGYRLNKYSSQIADGTFYGIDIGIDNLILGTKKVVTSRNTTLVNGNACNLPFRDNSISVVYTVVCLTHINHAIIKKAIDELIRVCSKDLLLVEVDYRPMKLRKKIDCVNWGYGYMHDYEKIVGRRMECVSVTPLVDANNHPRYTAFHYRVP